MKNRVATKTRKEQELPASQRQAGRVFVHAFGCQMNKLDSQIALESFTRKGYSPAENPGQADVIVFFTCAVRQHAEERFFSRLGAYAREKRRRPGLKVAVAGCVAQEHKERIIERYPFVDVVCGTNEFPRLPELIASQRAGSPVVATETGDISYCRELSLDPRPGQAYVSVMRGCNLRCSYCIVPSVRGRERSRPPADIKKEVEGLVSSGIREVTILGQTVNSYGRSLGREYSLSRLLYELAGIRGLQRLRFITSHPLFLGDDLIEAMSEIPCVCEGLHLPPQSGSDSVLKRMRRGYTRSQYLEIIHKCYERIPNFAPQGDVIVGFPGETGEDFLRTEELLRKVRFQNLFIFKYSPRPGTPAAGLPDDVPTKVKQQRNYHLLEVQKEISSNIYKAEIGKELEVLVEGPSKRNPEKFTGRTRTGKIVIFPKLSKPGEFLKLKIKDATHLALYGEAASEKNVEKD